MQAGRAETLFVHYRLCGLVERVSRAAHTGAIGGRRSSEPPVSILYLMAVRISRARTARAIYNVCGRGPDNQVAVSCFLASSE